MSIIAILLFAVSIANLLLGVIVGLRDSRRAISRSYFGLALSVGLWTASNGVYQITSPGLLYPTAQASYAAAALIATFFLLFNLTFTRTLAHARFGKPLVGAGVALAGMAFVPGLLAKGITADRTIETTLVIVPWALALMICFGYGLFILARFRRQSSGIERRQSSIIFGGMVLAAAFGLFFNLILPIAGNYRLVGLGPDFTILYLASIAYAIVKQRLFDIRLIIARSLTYLLVLTTLAASYIGLVFALSAIFVSGADRGSASIEQTFIYAFMSLVVALTFHPLRQLFEQLTDHIFYRYRYDTQTVLAAFSTVLVREQVLDELLMRSLHVICSSLDIEYGQLIIFKDERVEKVAHFGPLPQRLLVAPQLKLLDKMIIVVDDLADGERKELLESHGLRLSALLRTHGETQGYLLLGDKLSGSVYTSQDINVIGIMAKELVVAISNAQAYDEIQEFAKTLQDRVNHATGRLRVANRHLKELDRVKDEFISMASHQLRTPLTTIKGYLSMLLEGDAGEITDDQREFIDYAFSGSERMVHLISDLLDVSRLSAGRFIIQPRPTSIMRLVDEEARQLSQRAESKGIELNVVQPLAPIPDCMFDDVKTRQVIMNFIDNAIYYTNQGSVTVLLSVKGAKIHFEVRDTGIGVPEIAKRHLFTKFFRAENAQNTRPDGTGLGIYLAKRVVEDQGGTIIFSSTEGKGSIFGFELPLVPVSASSPKTTKALHG